MLLSKTYTFESAHQLPDWPDIHGHSYEVEIWLEAKGAGDYVLPMRKLDEAVAPVLKKIDHRMLNDLIDTPTMENVARWFWEELSSLPLHKIEIHRPSLKFRCQYMGGR